MIAASHPIEWRVDCGGQSRSTLILQRMRRSDKLGRIYLNKREAVMYVQAASAISFGWNMDRKNYNMIAKSYTRHYSYCKHENTICLCCGTLCHNITQSKSATVIVAVFVIMYSLMACRLSSGQPLPMVTKKTTLELHASRLTTSLPLSLPYPLSLIPPKGLSAAPAEVNQQESLVEKR